jgi:hypothetical protein
MRGLTPDRLGGIARRKPLGFEPFRLGGLGVASARSPPKGCTRRLLDRGDVSIKRAETAEVVKDRMG